MALPAIGVGGGRIEVFSSEDLQCLFSKHESLENASQQDALDFHAVLESIFKQVMVIPFRFPTVLHSEADLGAHLRLHGEGYRQDLHRFGQLVQMELHLSAKEAQPALRANSSGTEYLKARSQNTQALASAAQQSRQLLGEMLRDWQQVAPLGEDQRTLRCYALIARSDMQRFREKLVSHSVPAGVTMALSGPWPPTAFMSSVANGATALPLS